MIDYNIRAYINKEKEDDRGLVKELAKIANLTVSPINKWLKDEKKEFDSLESLLAIMKKMYPDNFIEAVEHYALTINLNKVITRQMLEFLSCNRLLKSMKTLIERMMASKNEDIKMWAKAYELQYQYQVNFYEIDRNSHMKKVRGLKANDPTLECFIELMKCNMYYHKKNEKMAYEVAEEVLKMLEDIDDGYIKKAYSVKLNEIYSYINLWLFNNPEVARGSSYKVIEADIGETFNAYAYFTIGFSYFYSSYDKAEEYLSRSVSIYKSINRNDVAEDIEGTIEKLNIFWNKEFNKANFIDFKNELYYRAKEKFEINSLIPGDIEEDDIGDILFAQGLSVGNKDLLMQSMIFFLKRGGTFEAVLPMIELIKLGEDQKTLQDLISINSN